MVAEDLEAAGAPSDDVMEANARFIAAAPELLEAAEAFMVEYRSNVIDIATRERLETAIARSMGGYEEVIGTCSCGHSDKAHSRVGNKQFCHRCRVSCSQWIDETLVTIERRDNHG